MSEMDGAKFSKLFKDTKTFDKKFTATDADLIFAKVGGGRTVCMPTCPRHRLP